MKFKIDENLPVDCANILLDSGFDAESVLQENIQGCADPYFGKDHPSNKLWIVEETRIRIRE